MSTFTKSLIASLLTTVFLLPSISLAQTAPLGDSNPNTSSGTGDCIHLENNMSYGMVDSAVNGEVTDLQTFLKAEGYLKGTTSGSFGVNTRNAVKAFQKDVLTDVQESDIDTTLVPSASDRHTLSVSGFLLSNSGYVGKYTRAKIAYVSCLGDATNAVDSVKTTPVISKISVDTKSKKMIVEGNNLNNVTSLQYTASQINGLSFGSTLKSIDTKSVNKVVFIYGSGTNANLIKNAKTWTVTLTTPDTTSSGFVWDRGGSSTTVCAITGQILNSSGICTCPPATQSSNGICVPTSNTTTTTTTAVDSTYFVNGVINSADNRTVMWGCGEPSALNGNGNTYGSVTPNQSNNLNIYTAQTCTMPNPKFWIECPSGLTSAYDITSPIYLRDFNGKTATCSAPSSATQVTGNLMLNPMFSSIACKVPLGASTCSQSLSWNYSNIPTAGSLTLKLRASSTLSYVLPKTGSQTTPSSSYSIKLPVGTHTFYIDSRDGTGKVESLKPELSVVVTCDTGLTPNSAGVCGNGLSNVTPTISLTADGSPVQNNGTINAVGGNTTLTWSTINATACTFDGSYLATSGGTQSFTGLVNGTHTISCVNGSQTASLTFNVVVNALPLTLNAVQARAYYEKFRAEFDATKSSWVAWGLTAGVTPSDEVIFAQKHWVNYGRNEVLQGLRTVTSQVVSLLDTNNTPTVLGDFTSNISCVDIPRNLIRGSESSSVTDLQDFLFDKGFLNETSTGFYGDKTVEAVKDYQASKNLPVTGMVYDFTRQAIQEETCK